MAYLTWPMQLGPDGRFLASDNPDDVWAGRMAQVLCARTGERVMRDDYGTSVAEALFHNALDDPETAIREAVKKWLPNIQVDNVRITENVDAYSIVVEYTTPDRTVLTTSVGLAVPNE